MGYLYVVPSVVDDVNATIIPLGIYISVLQYYLEII